MNKKQQKNQNVKKRRKKRRVQKFLLKLILTVIIALALAALIVFKVFTVQNVTVKGNSIYSDEKIQDWVLNDKYSWNSLYVFFKYKFTSTKEVPFVDSMKISLKSPHNLQVQVYEKGVLGYLYVPSLGKNAYIDKDGFVVELSNEIIQGTTKIIGLSVPTATLYEKLPLEDTSVLKTLLNVTQLLKKYELVPESIYVTSDSQVLLNYGSIQVNVGGNIYLNEKIVRLREIKPKLDGMTGTLHMENWSEINTDIYFDKDELTEIPNDVQTVPASDEESQTDPAQGDGTQTDSTAEDGTQTDPATGDDAQTDPTAEDGTQTDPAAGDGTVQEQ